MSWSFSVPVGPAGASEFRERAEAVAETYMTSYTASDEEKAAMRESIQESIDVAVSLLPMVQPDLGGQAGAFLSGHANPGHRPRSGYSNDTITVTVNQA
jgi:hypothetical protein